MEVELNYRKSDIYGPFKLLTTVTRQKCTRCNCVDEVDFYGAKRLLEIMEVLGAFPEISLVDKKDFNKYYFEINYCSHCVNGNEGDLEIKIRELSK
jgi:hypothetical protein